MEQEQRTISKDYFNEIHEDIRSQSEEDEESLDELDEEEHYSSPKNRVSFSLSSKSKSKSRGSITKNNINLGGFQLHNNLIKMNSAVEIGIQMNNLENGK